MRAYRPMTYHPILTARRREWLEKLEHDTATPRQGRSGFECQKLGWSDWLYDSDGNIIGETLTDEGRAVLLAAKED